ncbi:MarR family winged helix-turn-helix transcriptional regulator [Paenibacillus sp. JDR-2]|uniref:MarR family winged helix-turn-helix transcriptional regulator n=1 Tax=Paenibacillus sp. (strain JDR-2) TaxID=324057 RepID=UPI000166AEA5|nr:MarR family transcriptional regulator [Paenibacillus sp. JDR-2]ACT04570.1 transcriptional regulator, MarR family [Paenibacillus sp. JDR-2]
MDTNELLKLENQLCFAFYSCSREITKLYRPLLAELGLTYTQYITMLALWEQDNVSVKELGVKLLLDSGTLTPLLKKLESMGLLTRARDKSDERHLIVRLTEQGQALKDKASCVPLRLFEGTAVEPEEIFALRSQVQTLMSKMNDAT